MRVLRWPLLLLWLGWIATLGSEPALARGADRDWERLPIDEPVLRIDAPASGALFARTKAGLLRSNDGGLTWADVPLPAPRAGGSEADAVVVDPNDHTVLYAEGADGLYQSTVEPVSWSLILPLKAPIDSIVVSPADSAVVYVAAKQENDRGPIFLGRSDDRGASWTADTSRQIIMDTSSRTVWITLAAHATNPDRLVESWNGGGGRNYLGNAVRVSDDRGKTNRRLPMPLTLSVLPRIVIDGLPGNPARMYVLQHTFSGQGGRVGRSDDAGESWAEVYQALRDPVPNGLAVDPTNPDRLFLGHFDFGRGAEGARTELPILSSLDAGVTWTPLSESTIGHVHSLRLGIDGAWLFAGTTSGVWRYPLLIDEGR